MTDTAQRRAELAEIARKLVLQINEIQPFQWDKHDDKDQAIVLAALSATAQQARREALEAAVKVCNERAAFYEAEEAKAGDDKQYRLTRGIQRNEASCCANAIDRLREGR